MARGNWREADLRGPGRRPASVATVVETVGRALAALRAAEAVLFGLAAATVTLAAAVASGVAAGRREGWLVALAAGGCAGLAWWLAGGPGARAGRTGRAAARRRSALPRHQALAARMDSRLRHQGALATAYEAELRGSATPCARLLSHRVLERLRTREALRAMLPPLLPPVAAPLVAAFLLAGAIERARPDERGGPPPARELVEGLLAGFDRLESAAAAGPEPAEADTRAALSTIDGRLRELSSELRRGPADERALEELERVERELERQSAALGASPALRRELSALRAWLDEARRAVQRELGPGERGPDAGEPSSGVRSPGLAGGPAPDAGSSGSSLAPTPPTGTMAGDPAGAASEPPSPAGEEAGAASVGSWWPREHDPVVERWVEARRRALADPTGGGARR